MLNLMAAHLAEHTLPLLDLQIQSSHLNCLRRPSSQRSRSRQQTCILQTFLQVSRSTSRNSTSLQVKKKSPSMKVLLMLSKTMSEQAVEFLYHSLTCPAAVEFSMPVCSESTVNCLKDKVLNCSRKTQNVCSVVFNSSTSTNWLLHQPVGGCRLKPFASISSPYPVNKKEN